MQLTNINVVVTVKEFESSIGNLSYIYHSGVLEKVSLDFSVRKIRGTCLVSVRGGLSGTTSKPEKSVEYFSFDNPNIDVEFCIDEKG